MNKIKKIRLIITVVFMTVLLSCAPYVTHKWVVKVTYTNGDVDTLNIQCESRNKTHLYIQTSEQRGFGAAEVPACLIAYDREWGKVKTFCCGVRKFEILEND